VKSVSETACRETWTGVMRLKGDRLPDLKQWRREFRATVGELFVIEGVEATIDGRLVLVGGEPALRMRASKTLVRLGPLRQKVQIDPKRRQPQSPTAAEKGAYKRLAARLAGHEGPAPRVRVVGPLRQDSKGGATVLAVREYVWD
jgi:hypothetical protein